MTSTRPVRCNAFLSSTSDGRALLRSSRTRRNTGRLVNKGRLPAVAVWRRAHAGSAKAHMVDLPTRWWTRMSWRALALSSAVVVVTGFLVLWVLPLLLTRASSHGLSVAQHLTAVNDVRSATGTPRRAIGYHPPGRRLRQPGAPSLRCVVLARYLSSEAEGASATCLNRLTVVP